MLDAMRRASSSVSALPTEGSPAVPNRRFAQTLEAANVANPKCHSQTVTLAASMLASPQARRTITRELFEGTTIWPAEAACALHSGLIDLHTNEGLNPPRRPRCRREES